MLENMLDLNRAGWVGSVLVGLCACAGSVSTKRPGTASGNAGGGKAGQSGTQTANESSVGRDAGRATAAGNGASADADGPTAGVGGATGGAGGKAGQAGNGGTGSTPAKPAVIVACENTGTFPDHDETGTPGVWQDVTPPDLSLNKDLGGMGNNYGVQDILTDPCSPNVMYAFACYQGVWRSTDYGLTWSKISTSKDLDGGRPWTGAIDPGGVMYTTAGYGKGGIYKSTDRGVTWTQIASDVAGLGTDIYAIDIDPYDPLHLIATFHNKTNVAESMDGGLSWTAHGGGTTLSQYAFFIDTGAADTTRTTWLTINQAHDNETATFRTTDAGAQWTNVLADGHIHGSGQLIKIGNALYVPLSMGVYKSIDLGVTWTRIDKVSETSLIATKTKLYASYGWPVGQAPRTAPLSDETTWTDQLAPSSAMAGSYWGGKRLNVTTDSKRWYVVGGMWQNGIWRFAEP